MTPRQHYELADEALAQADEGGWPTERIMALSTLAQAHAQLAAVGLMFTDGDEDVDPLAGTSGD